MIAILEPRISGDKVDSVILKNGILRIGMDGAVRVEASGFSGGISCLWKQARLAISVISTYRYCVRLKVNPNSVALWYLLVIYASRQFSSREFLRDELRGISSSIANFRLWWENLTQFNMILRRMVVLRFSNILAQILRIAWMSVFSRIWALKVLLILGLELN